MSFSSDVKTELCRQGIRKCCAIAEAYGILLYCNTFSGSEIKLITASGALAERTSLIFRRAFDMAFDEAQHAGSKHILIINDKSKIRAIFSRFGYSPETSVSLHLNLSVIEDDCCRAAFIRGAFLAGGSVTDPQKRYHLELVTSHYHVSRETFSMLLDLGFSPKETSRKSNYVTYFKQSEYIADFLTLVGAPVASMDLMNAKAEKDLRNGVNRRVNCDTANLGKAVDASMEQLEAIRRIEAVGAFEALPEKLKITAALRREYPEATLTELAAAENPPITKSCLNHRLRKLIELSKNL